MAEKRYFYRYHRCSSRITSQVDTRCERVHEGSCERVHEGSEKLLKNVYLPLVHTESESAWTALQYRDDNSTGKKDSFSRMFYFLY